MGVVRNRLLEPSAPVRTFLQQGSDFIVDKPFPSLCAGWTP